MNKALSLPDIVEKDMHKSEEKKSRSTYDHVIKYTSLFGGVQGLGLLASIVRNKLVAELLGPAGLGLISLYNAAATLLSNSTNFGISFSAVRHVSELYEEGDKEALERFIQVVRTWSMAAALLGMVVCAALSPLLSISYFEDTTQWLSFIWLSPVVGLMALTGGELAILKGTRCLRRVALQSLINSLCALVISVPLFYVWGERAILCSLVMVALCTFVTTLYFSARSYPVTFKYGYLGTFTEGKKMVSLGTAFILAGILGSGVEFLIRAYMVQRGSEADVGMYSAGYLLTVTYASMVFTAMETDFYPRLSAVNHDIRKSNDVVNRQIEASVLLIAPMLVALWVALPILLPLLYNEEFLPVIGMGQCAIFGMYMRSVTLPIAYLSLAKGRSRVFLFTEATYYVVAVFLIIYGYASDGLRGAGIALSVAAAFDLLLVWLTARKCYDFVLSSESLRMLFVQFPIGVATFMITTRMTGLWYWVMGFLCILCSGGLSVYFLSKQTVFIQKIWGKIINRSKF